MVGETGPEVQAAVDIGQVIDERRWGGYQSRVVLLTGLAVVMDGLDNRLLPLAIPQLLHEWGVARNAFALATSVGLIGMALGTVLGGMIGDRVGRRPTIIGSVMAFGAITALNAFVNDITSMIVMRFLAGLGLGALMPAAAAMFAEFAPARHRALAVTLGMVCIPLGGTLSGLLGAAVLPVPGWRALFLIGGVLAIAVAVMQIFMLPESPRFLARDPAHRARLKKVLSGLGYELGDKDQVITGTAATSPFQSIRKLFTVEFRRDTIGLWGAFCAILLCLYMESQWMPTLLSAAGYSLQVASIAASCLAFGGMFACVLGIAVVARFGSRVGLMGMAAAGVVLAVGLTQYPLDPRASPVPLLVLLTIAGFLIGGLQIMIYSVATNVYPTELRATGIGWAVGIGRLGSVVSPFVANAAIGLGGWSAFFVALAIGLGLTLMFLGMVRRHVPARG